MSYPAPPPPGQGGSYNGPNPYQPNPSGSNPYGPPPKKDNTLWWILGGIAAIVVICCIGVCGFLVVVGLEADDQYSSVSSSVSSGYSPQNEKTAAATTVSEGGSTTVDGVHVESGWSVVGDNVSGLSIRNDTGDRGMLAVTFYLMDGSDVIDDVTCTSSFIDAGEIDDSPSCISAFTDIDDHTAIRAAEGY